MMALLALLPSVPDAGERNYFLPLYLDEIRLFPGAVLELAGPDPQRERLINAYRYNLAHLSYTDIPDNLWTEFEAFQQEITRKVAVGERDRVEATVMSMSELKVKNLIESIFSMYDAVLLAAFRVKV